MATFTRRYTKPTGVDKSFVLKQDGGWNDCIVGSPTDPECRCLANCVGYASGRFNEIYNELTGKSGCNYPYLNCNAENFIERVKQKYPEIEISDVAKPGAIMCWRKGKAGVGEDGAGHVAIVEEILERDENGFPISVKTSESSWSGTAFFNAVRNYNNGNWVNWKDYYFRGFIYCPAEDNMPVPVERNKYVDQMEIMSTVLRVRTEPSLSGTVLGMATPGFYNIIKQARGDDYLWCEIADGCWCAVMDGASQILPKEEKWKEPKPVEKSEKQTQIYIPDFVLRIREEPSIEALQMGVCQKNSYYNVLDMQEKEDYTWYQIGEDAWCAGVDGVICYLKEDSEKVKELKAEIAALKAEVKELKEDNKELKNSLSAVEEDLKVAEDKLSKIKTKTAEMEEILK